MMSGSEQEEDILFDLMNNGEDEKLLNKNSRPEKISGKAWGRVKNIFVRKSQYPCSIYYILGTEFCERFCYYGLRAILVLYLTNWLGFNQNDGVALYHVTSMLAYFSPILGAIMADGYLGRYKTIMYLSIVYCIGNVVLALTALPPKEKIGPIIGLIIIGLGTGGIKPCVSAFGGDQFPTEREKERMTFFSAFYFMINLGSVLSTFITPILRANVHCLEDTCYPLAFGVPGILMFIAVVIFIAGRRMYKHVPPTGNIIGKVVKCIWEHFLVDVKILVQVLVLFFPLPLFWALFDQQGSRWTLQAQQMDGSMGKLGRLIPDQMQVLNPLLILLLIPIFEHFIYPLLDFCNLPTRPLQRMTVGMLFGAMSFVIAGLLQVKLDFDKEVSLKDGESGVTFINSLRCDANITSSMYNGTLPPYWSSNYTYIKEGNYSVSFDCGGRVYKDIPVELESLKTYTLVLMNTTHGLPTIKQFNDLRMKSKSGSATVNFISNLPYTNRSTEIKLVRVDGNDPLIKIISRDNATVYCEVEPGAYDVFIPWQNSSGNFGWTELAHTVYLGTGGVYSMVFIQPAGAHWPNEKIDFNMYVRLNANTLSMLYLVPQYVVITIAEILFSITGLSFAYSQAPAGLKSVVQAAWLTTTAVGDLIVVIVAEIQMLPSQSAEFFLFAVLMVFDTVIFALVACFCYTYIVFQPTISDSDTDTLVTPDKLTEETELSNKGKQE